MRGVNQRKHKAMHEEGVLKLLPRPMAYKGTAHAWLRNLGRREEQEDWTKEPRNPDPPQVAREILKEIMCPECEGTQSTKDHRLLSKTVFSQMKCQTCHEVNSIMRWNCMCGIKWFRCGLHVRRNLMQEFSHVEYSQGIRNMPKRGASMSQEHVIDRPMPTKRHVDGKAVNQSLQVEQRGFLFPNSSLAQRFPHHVKRGAEV